MSSMKYFDENGNLGTICHTGHNTLMDGFDLKDDFERWKGGVEPLDAPDWVPAGCSWLIDTGYVEAFPATRAVER